MQAFKPDPRAYRMGVDAFGMEREEIAFAAFARFRSRREHTFADKLLSAMRAQFGGHQEAKIESD